MKLSTRSYISLRRGAETYINVSPSSQYLRAVGIFIRLEEGTTVSMDLTVDETEQLIQLLQRSLDQSPATLYQSPIK